MEKKLKKIDCFFEVFLGVIITAMFFACKDYIMFKDILLIDVLLTLGIMLPLAMALSCIWLIRKLSIAECLKIKDIWFNAYFIGLWIGFMIYRSLAGGAFNIIMEGKLLLYIIIELVFTLLLIRLFISTLKHHLKEKPKDNSYSSGL